MSTTALVPLLENSTREIYRHSCHSHQYSFSCFDKQILDDTAAHARLSQTKETVRKIPLQHNMFFSDAQFSGHGLSVICNNCNETMIFFFNQFHVCKKLVSKSHSHSIKLATLREKKNEIKPFSELCCKKLIWFSSILYI